MRQLLFREDTSQARGHVDKGFGRQVDLPKEQWSQLCKAVTALSR